MATKSKKAKKCSGFHKADCQKYRAAQVRETGKARKLCKHLKAHRNDKCAIGALRRARKAYPLAVKKPVNKFQEWEKNHNVESVI